jgi:tetratricopeptide (TPR) repeat protein
MFRWRPRPSAKEQNAKDLWRKSEKLVRKGKADEAEQTLLSAAQSLSPIDRHYAYIKIIRLYTRQIAQGQERRTELEDICKKDIDLFPDFYEAWMVEYLNSVPTPYFPSFSVLAEIYEKEGKLDEAISLCELALGYELSESTGEDFPAKLERLYAKR